MNVAFDTDKLSPSLLLTHSYIPSSPPLIAYLATNVCGTLVL